MLIFKTMKEKILKKSTLTNTIQIFFNNMLKNLLVSKPGVFVWSVSGMFGRNQSSFN